MTSVIRRFNFRKLEWDFFGRARSRAPGDCHSALCPIMHYPLTGPHIPSHRVCCEPCEILTMMFCLFPRSTFLKAPGFVELNLNHGEVENNRAGCSLLSTAFPIQEACHLCSHIVVVYSEFPAARYKTNHVPQIFLLSLKASHACTLSGDVVILLAYVLPSILLGSFRCTSVLYGTHGCV